MRESFLEISEDSDFGIENLPYGIFSIRSDPTPRIGVAIGNYVLDVREVHRAGFFGGPILSQSTCFGQSELNDFMALGRSARLEARETMQRLLSAQEGALRDDVKLRSSALYLQKDVEMHLPAKIGNFTDFYCSKEHASNCGKMFRGAANLLQPNWLHLPVAYHSRASSVVISGTDVRRPWGQVMKPRNKESDSRAEELQYDVTFEPSSVVDFELEMGCLIGPGTELGSHVPIDEAEDHMFGFVLVNDWSARDIQKWEYVPLGPFASKNWATSVSPWVVTLEALDPFKIPAPIQDPPALPYLTPSQGRYNYDIEFEVVLNPAAPLSSNKDTHKRKTPAPSDSSEPTTTGSFTSDRVIARSSMQTLYWTIPQMIAHHTAGGCNLQPGDLIATGTLSKEGDRGQGCLLELSWNGTREIHVSEGETRRFLEDGDEIALHGSCRKGSDARKNHPQVGFGTCSGRLLPAHRR